MTQLTANGLQIEVETHGDPAHPAMLLIMGLGMQLTSWPMELVDGLVKAGFYVIRHDNRDAGLSQQFDERGAPNMIMLAIRHAAGMKITAPYSLEDMAADALGVLDALGVRQAHVVGASMGGMIGQILTSLHPDRVLSFTSIMSSSGRIGIRGPTSRANRALFSRPKGTSEQALVDHYVKVFRVIGSPAFPMPEDALRARILVSVQRARRPQGTLRQMTAIVANGSRVPYLEKISRPTLVVHGDSDPLVSHEAGDDTAKTIPGARMQVVKGMGHDLPPQVIAMLLEWLPAHASSAALSAS